MIITLTQNSNISAGQLRNMVNNDWLVFVLLLLLMLYILIERNRQSYLFYIAGKGLAVTVDRISLKYWKTRNRNLSFLLTIAFIINISLLIVYCLRFWNLSFINADIRIQFILIICLVSGYVIIKTIIYKLIGYLLDINDIIKEYLSNKYLQFQIYGVILFPFSCLILFISEHFKLLLIIIVLFILISIHITSILRAISIFTFHKFSKFYMILYLCALEILPILIVGKLFYSLK